ncbi:hypothetical protein [Paracoccus shanxieyensis]|uniref:Uncharacterized protein n=1 Tax=Paracoccus shanxieyensis TaxID=2675752 RepID=A0A6L6J1S9_9RHOB|nr:hypothetical protein [Paracoccus shanxieyensis]MTH64724.1 hypothetical protein [Paracoccus shanxieyensis]MTH87868.1 hypothetical protein [Paracoccus shanxieyensis]
MEQAPYLFIRKWSLLVNLQTEHFIVVDTPHAKKLALACPRIDLLAGDVARNTRTHAKVVSIRGSNLPDQVVLFANAYDLATIFACYASVYGGLGKRQFNSIWYQNEADAVRTVAACVGSPAFGELAFFRNLQWHSNKPDWRALINGGQFVRGC